MASRAERLGGAVLVLFLLATAFGWTEMAVYWAIDTFGAPAEVACSR